MVRPIDVRSVFGTHDRLRADYDGARDSRFRRKRRGVGTTGLPADYHYRSTGDHLKLMELARDMDRNDPYLGQLVDRAVDNIVQGGFTLDPDSGDQEFDKIAKQTWYEWAENRDACDLAGETTFVDREHLVLRQALVDGDVFEIPTGEGSLQGVEAHRCRSPQRTQRNVVNGVLLGENRRRLEYWFTKNDIDPLAPVKLVGDITPFKARNDAGFRNVFHVYRGKRFSQTRGVTALAPIFDFLGMGADAVFAKIVQQLIANCFAIFRERDASFAGDGEDAVTGAVTNERLSDGSNRLTQGISPGMEIIAKKGEKLSGFSPNLGNTDFLPLIEHLLSVIGANLGMPLIMVLMDTGNTNFSSWRGAYDQAKMGFRRRQQALATQYHYEVYRWKMRQKIASDPALFSKYQEHGERLLNHTWGYPSWPYVDPFKDAAADLLEMRNNLNSPRRIHARKGNDYPEIVRETLEDNAAVIEGSILKARELNAKYKVDLTQPIHWREVMSLPTPDGVSVAIPVEADDKAGADKTKKTGSGR